MCVRLYSALVAALALGLVAAAPAHSQALAAINANMVLLTAVVPGSGTSGAGTAVVAQKGALAVSSLAFANFGVGAATILIEKAIYSNSNCSGSLIGVGRYFYALVPPGQTSQLTYPTPLAFFPDQFGTVCLQFQNSGDGNVNATVVGYTQ